jgi:hypothetical protein
MALSDHDQITETGEGSVKVGIGQDIGLWIAISGSVDGGGTGVVFVEHLFDPGEVVARNVCLGDVVDCLPASDFPAGLAML